MTDEEKKAAALKAQTEGNVNNLSSTDDPNKVVNPDIMVKANETSEKLPKTNEQTEANEVKPRTMQEYLAEMPQELRESVEGGLKLHSEKKASLIKALKDTKRCEFTDDQLKAFNIEQLQSLAKLAAVPDFGGRATPKINSEDEEKVPAAPLAFAPKVVAAA